jgi:hypothetical protein
MEAHTQEREIDSLQVLSGSNDNRGYKDNEYGQMEPSHDATPPDFITVGRNLWCNPFVL